MRKQSYGSVKIFSPSRDRAEVVRHIRERLPALAAALPLHRVVLFGSYARGDYTVRSDVDVLVVYAGSPRPDAYALVRRALDLPGLQPHVYSEEEYRRAAPVVGRMEAGGLLLYPMGR